MSTSRSGRLHLARSGPMVYLHAADGDGEFRKLAEADFGTENLMFVRLATLYDGAGRGLDVLWKDLSIHAESLPSEPGSPSDPTIPRAWLVALGAVTLVVILGITWRRRRAGA